MSFFPYMHVKKGFTLVELLVGIMIFSVGITGIFILLQSTMTSAALSRSETVVANLLREEIELMHNIRDTNIQNYTLWDKVRIEGLEATSSGFFSSGTYIVENNFENTDMKFDEDGNIGTSPVIIKPLKIPDGDGQEKNVLQERFTEAQLFLDKQGRYTHQKEDNRPMPYASYVIIRPIEFENAGQTYLIEKDGRTQGYSIDARVITSITGQYREYDAKTLLTDWIQ